MVAHKLVYLFREGSAEMKEKLGGKGANLAEMTRVGLPVPPGFTISTEACNEYYRNGQRISDKLMDQLRGALSALEKTMVKKLGDVNRPLLVSVRSGAVFSMPGMMDTILNLGLNDESVIGLMKDTGDPRFAYDCYRRFIQMFSDVVLGVDHYLFERILEGVKRENGYKEDPELQAEDWKGVIDEYLALVRKETGEPFPQEPMDQLVKAISAVFNSWNNQRAMVYRRIHKIPNDLGTAVNVQAMVFGNRGEDCGTGVAFTRNPSTGESMLYGEYLVNAQGEDVVAGIRTPQPISSLADVMPAVYEQFREISGRLEKHYKDMQDIEFTVENGRLYVLQTRNGKRTAHAAVKIAVDMVREGLLTKEEALLRVDPNQLDQMLHRRMDPSFQIDPVAKGLPASPGAASGRVVFDADVAEQWAQTRKEKVLLVRPETTPEDIHGIVAAEGILTSRGGMTSHAAVVARGMGKPCICGCDVLNIDLAAKQFTVAGHFVREGDVISIDGGTGTVMLGEVPMIDPELSDEFRLLLRWADEVRRLGVRANADNPEDAQKARELGAEGIGLCRTEHMFMAADRVPAVQAMIMAATPEERLAALSRLLPMQQGDFAGIFRAMDGLPVTIRLLDPPLHEFLPNVEELLVDLTLAKAKADAGLTTPAEQSELARKEALMRKVRALHEQNPMLGHRGCRLGIVFPEIYAMQAKAIFEAMVEVMQQGVRVIPEIMIPLVGEKRELETMRVLVVREAEEVSRHHRVQLDYKIGTMIEVPRAALTADEIAECADFFSFGTNDLTQTTFGYSRDDAEGKFLHHYIEQKILKENPFQVLDVKGVGKLIQMGVTLGRTKNPSLKTGICGEHGGEKESIRFCHEVGLDYVSCSPFRVPIARLAAAHAAILHK